MDFIFKTFQQLSTLELYTILQLRSKVFVVEQQCACLEEDGHDKVCWHLMMKDKGELIGYLRILPVGIEAEDFGGLGRIVLDEQYRGQGLGHLLVDKGLQLYKEVIGEDVPIMILAQNQLVSFYSKHGFKPKGEPFMFEQRMHIVMTIEHQGTAGPILASARGITPTNK